MRRISTASLRRQHQSFRSQRQAWVGAILATTASSPVCAYAPTVVEASWWDKNSGALTFAGFVVAIIVFVIQEVRVRQARRTKTLDYYVGPSRHVTLGTDVTESESMSFVFAARQFESSMTVVNVIVINTGTEPVRPDDYNGGLRIEFPIGIEVAGGAKVVRMAKAMGWAKPLGKYTKNFASSDNRGGVDLVPILMNPGDWLEVQFLLNVDLDDKLPIVSATVAGLSRSPKRLQTLPKGLAS